jgi:hypothetical protein
LALGPGRKKAPNIEDGSADGQMLFWDNILQRYSYTEISELIWDDTDKELGIGTNSPNEPLHVRDDIDGNIGIRVQNESTGTAAVARIIVDGSGGSSFYTVYGSGFTQDGAKIPSSAALVSNLSLTGGLSIVSRSTTAPLRFYVSGNTDADLQMTIDIDGNVDLKSTTGTLIVSRLTTTERNALTSPQNGMIIYNTTDNKFQGYENGVWSNLI